MSNEISSLTLENTNSDGVIELKSEKNEVLIDNPIVLRALRRLKDNQEKGNHVSHYTKHGSYSSHSKGW